MIRLGLKTDMKKFFVAVALLAIAALSPSQAFAVEQINDFASDIAIATDGTLTVRETINVHVEGDQIKHGIFRDFPTTYYDRMGNRVRVRFDVSEVTRDGNSEKFDTETLDNGVRVKIGDPDIYLDPGDHIYVLTYQTNRQIGFFDNYDELYWNVTGNGWQFPIAHVSASVHLPPGASMKQYSFYTGSQGATGKDAEESMGALGTIDFSTTTGFVPGEGLTIAVGFTKGIVKPPTQGEQRAEFLRDNASAGAALAGLAALFIYYFITWWRFGRDPKHGPIVPLFAPPKGFSPAAVRDVHRMGYDRKSFAASLIDMAVKGYQKIVEKDGEYTLKRTGKSEMDCGLDKGETAIAKAFFDSPDDTIVLKNTSHSEVSNAINGLKAALKNEYEKAYFVNNSGWFFGGIAILALTGIGAALLSDNAAPAIFMIVWLSGWSVGTAFLVHRAWDVWVTVFRGPGSRVVNFFAALFASLFAIPFLGGLIAVFFALGTSLPWLVTLALIAQGIMAYVFYHLLKAPTLAGASIRDQIDGFRMFLMATEKDRLEKLNPPQITPQVFEKFLPYAIALDCENQWSKKFEAEAARAGQLAGGTGYVPVWYSGPSYSRLGTAGFAGAIGASVAGAAAAASSAPGSSSGSGGGGFSGGGGGGGGGGGW